ncbi:hypothetical protein BJX64DRAFT_284860 [Aspergillus heterothallicus]
MATIDLVDLTTSSPRNNRQANEDLAELRFSPFLFLDVPAESVCSLKDLTNYEFDFGSTRDIPKFVWPENEQVRFGLAVETVQDGDYRLRRAYDFAYIRVDSDGSHTILDGANVPLSPASCQPDPAFDTDLKIKCYVLEMLELWRDELRRNLRMFDEDLSCWRMMRRGWEMELIKRLEEKRLIAVSENELARLRKRVREDIDNDEDDYNECVETFLTEEERSKLKDMWRGQPARTAAVKLEVDLTTAISCIKMHIESMGAPPRPRERLLMDLELDFFVDDDDNNEALKPIVPIPEYYQRRQFYNWCLERHANWAKEGAFTRKTYHAHFQLGRLRDIMSNIPHHWPRGNHGLVAKHVRFQEDLKTYPWGLPASKLSTTLAAADLQHIFYDVSVRKYLQRLEEWYFEQDLYDRTELRHHDLRTWKCPQDLVQTLDEFFSRGYCWDTEDESSSGMEVE